MVCCMTCPSIVCTAMHLSAAWILHWSSAVNVHVSQAYRKMDFTIVSTSFSFVLILILQSFHNNLRYDITAAACAVLARISGIEPASQEMAPRYLKWLTDSSSDPPTVGLFWRPFLLLVITFIFLAFISMLYFLQTELKTLHQLGKFGITFCHNVYIISISQI